MDINDVNAMSLLCDQLACYILEHSVLTGNEITHHRYAGSPDPKVDDDDDSGFLITIGHGLGKHMQSTLTQKEQDEIKQAIAGTLKGNVPMKMYHYYCRDWSVDDSHSEGFFSLIVIVRM
ncbi:hypothetical protein RhiJN_10059 [Ceratobasidium sp. AG-Ba]|nr:hypothetical protein RhiJN_10059 [Ceratobasidium sp. AG-Ba]QRW10823.1 hypothetical protein RhiLY_09822 [Ceratobasidium sp. AG-Ba]